MAKQSYSAVYNAPRTFLQYAAGRVIVYPDERVVDDYQPEKSASEESAPAPFKAYIYTGEERDGGFIRECPDSSDYHDMANAIIRTRYSVSEELALQRHHQANPDAYATEWQAYCDFADAATSKAKKWLGIIK